MFMWCAIGGDGPSPDGSPFLPFKDDSGQPLAIWVASTISQIPPGSMIINPHSHEPYKNRDGSIFRWYPPAQHVPEKELPRDPSAETKVSAHQPVPEIVPEASRHSARGVSRHQPGERTQVRGKWKICFLCAISFLRVLISRHAHSLEGTLVIWV